MVYYSQVGTQYHDTISAFFVDNWLNLCLVFVGCLALVIYWLQERKKETEAAALIVQQVDELQQGIRTIDSYIQRNLLNENAFYESHILYSEDYWGKYKHYFVRKMDSKSYGLLNDFYGCAYEIREQQELTKNLQKNSFFQIQQVITNMEANYIANDLINCVNNPLSMEKVKSAVKESCPNTMNDECRKTIENLIGTVASNNMNINMKLFWDAYNKQKQDIVNVINGNPMTCYIPMQITLSLQKSLERYKLIQIEGCEGYRYLCRIAKRKF